MGSLLIDGGQAAFGLGRVHEPLKAGLVGIVPRGVDLLNPVVAAHPPRAMPAAARLGEFLALVHGGDAVHFGVTAEIAFVRGLGFLVSQVRWYTCASTWARSRAAFTLPAQCSRWVSTKVGRLARLQAIGSKASAFFPSVPSGETTQALNRMWAWWLRLSPPLLGSWTAKSAAMP